MQKTALEGNLAMCPNPEVKIRDIIQKKAGRFLRFRVHDCQHGKFALISEQRDILERFGETVRLDIPSKRLEQLANEILNYLGKKAKLREWNPTNEEYEAALERKYGKGGMNFFVIDWVRKVVNSEDKEGIRQARAMYSWLKGEEAWLMGEKET